MSGYAFLRQPRWLALGFLVLIVVPSFFLLSRWQLSRLDDRRHANAVVQANAQAQTVPVDSVMTSGSPTSSVTDDQQWRPVTATGRYDASRQVLVRKRPLEGANGFWVATPLITSSGATLVVNRGWIAAAGGAGAVQDVPAPPSGQVTVVGRVLPSEQAPTQQPTDLPAGQVTDLDVALVAGTSDVYPGYVELVSSDPAQPDGLRPVPLPDLSEGNHLSYAVQWIFFAIVGVGGFVLLVRREREYADSDGPEGLVTEKATRTDVA
jgi:cytochrome oxidase assembly protein ShyY1